MSFQETYSIWNYGEMISDQVRMEAYAAALRRHIDSTSVVLDIGTGTGIIAMLASRYGARRVFAVEPSVAVQVAREVARDNDLGAEIEFFQGISTEVQLPEKATVVVSDLRSILPLFQQHCRTIADARQRLLAPGGTLIPRRDTLWAGLVSGDKLYEKIVGPYRDNRFGFRMDAASRYVTNEWRKGTSIGSGDLFLEPQAWATLDYFDWSDPHVSGELVWEVPRSGTVNGFCVWFDAELSEGIGFSNAPGQPDLIYGRAFFPWSEPLGLAAGDRVVLRIAAQLAGNDYLWQWDTRVESGTSLKAEYQQTTFSRAPLSLQQLRKRTDDYVPELGGDGATHRFVLQQMDGRQPIGEISRRLSAEFPDRFPTWQDAFQVVAELSERYSR